MSSEERSSSSTRESDLLVENDLLELLDKLHDCRAKWFNLGVELPGLTIGDLRAVEYQYRDPRECLREVLIMWLRRVHPRPTRRVLAAALCSRAVGERQVALLVSDRTLSVPESTAIPAVTDQNHQRSLTYRYAYCLAAVLAVIISIAAMSRHLVVAPVKYQSWTLPSLHGPFIGRETDIEKIMKILDFDHSSTFILSVIGSPAIGKSTLAIHVGYQMEEMGVRVHYVDMTETPDITILATSILDSAGVEISAGSEAKKVLWKWAREVDCDTLLILDNCDAFYHDSIAWKQQLQDFIAKVTGVRIQQSGAIKFLLTSQNQLVFLDAYQYYHLTTLSIESATELFGSLIDNSLNTTIVEQICKRVDRSPLALKITAQILKQDICDVDCVGAQLGMDRIGLLSQPEFHRRMDVLFNLSYVSLQPEYQECGMQLSLFRESFTRAAAVTVLSSESAVVDKCLHSLQKSSLLEWFDKEGTRRYQFHRLTADFFCDKFFESYEGMEFFSVMSNYMEYYGNLVAHSKVPHEEQRNMFLYCAFTKILASEEFTSATSVVREKFCSDKESVFGSYSACLEQMKVLNEKIYEQLCLKFESEDSNYREAIEEISSRHHFRDKE